MSVKELVIEDKPIKFIFSDADSLKGYIKIEVYFIPDIISGIAVIDRNQAHLLMLYLQEQLK